MTYAPTVVYYAKDDLSKQLAASIPKKVNAWLANVGLPVAGSGMFGNLRWNFDLEAGTIIYGYENGVGRGFTDVMNGPQEADKNFVQVWYQGDPLNAQDVCCTDPRFEHLSHDLEFFTHLEKLIYSELEDLRNELTDDEPQFKLPSKE